MALHRRRSRRSLLLGGVGALLAACRAAGAGPMGRAPTATGGPGHPEPALLAPRLQPGEGWRAARPSQSTTPSSASAPVELVWRAGGGPAGLRCPTGLAADGQGTLTVVDAGHDRLVRFSATGQPLDRPGQFGGHPAAFNFLRPPDPELGATCLADGGVALDAGDGSTVVADRAQVWRLDRAGQIAAVWTAAGPDGRRLIRPAGVAVDARTRQVYVVDGGASRIHVYDRAGRWLRAWGEPSRFASPAAVAVDGQGRVYVADHGADRIQSFADDGRVLAAWGGPGVGAGEFLAPRGVAVDRTGRVYVVDMRRVQVFTNSGVLLAAWPVGGAGGGIAVDDRGLIAVTDPGHGLILRFRPRSPWPAVAGAPTPRPARPPATPGPPEAPTPPFMTPTNR